MFDWILSQRATRLARFLRSSLSGPGVSDPDTGRPLRLLDIGSGTGHNAVALAREGALAVEQVDVANLHTTGPEPTPFDGRTLPFPDRAFDAALLLFVLHYAEDPPQLLQESLRVAPRTLVLQSTYHGRFGFGLLWLREWLTGRGGFWFARSLGYVGGSGASLRVRGYYSPAELMACFQDAGARVVTVTRFDALLGAVSRDLYLLELAPRRTDLA